jgi:calcineurin-like phosphoesterase family protein
MTTWFTADLHLGHTNIIKYCARPFIDVEAMNRALLDRWNETVDVADDVWVLGDFALGKIDETLPHASELHGRKMLLAGNHDRCWAEHGRRADGWAERYLDAGFAEVRQGQIKIDIGGVTVLACHFPYRGDSHDNDRYAEQRPADRGAWLLHGHVHERWKQRGRMINVGVDAWGYRPVSAAHLGELINAGPMELAPAER